VGGYQIAQNKVLTFRDPDLQLNVFKAAVIVLNPAAEGLKKIKKSECFAWCKKSVLKSHFCLLLM
jgi:hypothetical protein